MTQINSDSIAWIAVDWGTTHMRVWAMDAEGRVLAHDASGPGMGRLSPEGFEPALIAVIGDWLVSDRVVPVMCCGMVGAKQGWIDAPYCATPCAPLHAEMFIAAPVKDKRIKVFVIPGLKQMSPADVMRGEETQMAGFLAQYPDFTGSVCLPGTHSKWVHMRAGRVERFTTFLTGELFALLSSQSVLRHSIGAEGWDDAAFEAGLDQALTQQGAIIESLFSIRADSLLHALSPQAARSRLSGLLIGAEIAGARAYWHKQDVAIVASDALEGIYGKALAQLGAKVLPCDGEGLALAGLTMAFNALKSARI